MSESVSAHDDLFFDSLVQGYVEKNPRFLRRDWLAKHLDEKLRESGKQFVLLTAEPGAGKSVFMAQLAHDHPDWLRYFIRRDQCYVLSDVSARSLLLRIGYQLAAQRPQLFTKEQLTLSVKMRLREVDKGGEAVGVEIDKLIQSPFYRNLGIDVDQQAEQIRGKLVAMRINELYIEERLLPDEDLLHLALIDPARVLMRLNPKEQIVIVIDALDEISYHKKPGDIVAWLTKCPELPENIRFVLTSRPPDESLKLFSKVPRLTPLPIEVMDPDVQRDIQQFVTYWVNEPAVTQAIHVAGGNPETFATNATVKAHGNLGYVDALARGIDRAIADIGGIDEDTRKRGHTTLEALQSLKELPDDQNGLYAFFLKQIKQGASEQQIVRKDSSGKTKYIDAWPAVYEPILGVLAVAMEPLQVDLLAKLGDIAVDLKWVRPAINRLTQFLDVNEGRYRLYHATVAEFLTAEKTRDHPDFDTAALYQDAVSQHRQIADHYWQYRDEWTKCDSYGLRNLAAHLDSAGQVERLHELITNAWMQARVSGDGYRYSGFIADLLRAWERAHTEAVRQIESNDAEFTSFATCFGYALIRTSIRSLSRNYLPALISRALQTKYWSVERALDVGVHVADHVQRAGMYVAILQADEILSGAQRHVAEQAALNTAQQIEDHSERAKVLTELASHLSGGEKTKALGEAIEAAQRIEGPEARVEALAELAPHLSEVEKAKVLGEALAAAQSIAGDEGAIALKLFAPTLSGLQVETALEAAMAITEGASRAQALADLAPRLSGEQACLALATTLAIEDKASQVWALAALVPRLSDEQKTQVLGDALKVALAIEEKANRVWALVALMPRLSEEQKNQALKDAFEVMLAIEDDEGRGWALCRLAPWLSKDQIEAALAVAEGISYEEARVEALSALMPQLDEEEVGTVFKMAQAIENEWARARLLNALIPRLNEHEIETALKMANALKSEEAQVEALTAFVPQLAAGQVTTILEMALVIKSEGARARLLATLTPRLSKAQTSLALAAMLRIKDQWRLSEALTALTPQLSGPQKMRVLNKALVAVTQAIKAVGFQYSHSEFLRLLVSQLSGSEVETALAVIQAIEEEGDQVSVLTALVPQLTGEQITATLEMAKAIKNEAPRAWLLSALAPRLSEDEVKSALELANALKGEEAKVQALTALAPRLSGVLKTQVLGHALALVPAIKNIGDRAHAFTFLALQLSGPEKTQALDRAVTAVTGIKDVFEYCSFKTLRALALQLSKEQVAALLSASEVGEEEKTRVWLLEALVPQLTEEQVSIVLEMAQVIKNKRARARLLTELAPRLSGLRQTEVLEKAFTTVQAIKDEGNRAFALAGLALHLSKTRETQLLDRAATAAHATEDLNDRLAILLALVTSSEQKRLVRECRQCLLDCVGQVLEVGTREGLLYWTIKRAAPRPPIIGRETIATIAHYLVEIDERWRWV